MAHHPRMQISCGVLITKSPEIIAQFLEIHSIPKFVAQLFNYIFRYSINILYRTQNLGRQVQSRASARMIASLVMPLARHHSSKRIAQIFLKEKNFNVAKRELTYSVVATTPLLQYTNPITWLSVHSIYLCSMTRQPGNPCWHTNMFFCLCPACGNRVKNYCTLNHVYKKTCKNTTWKFLDKLTSGSEICSTLWLTQVVVVVDSLALQLLYMNLVTTTHAQILFFCEFGTVLYLMTQCQCWSSVHFPLLHTTIWQGFSGHTSQSVHFIGVSDMSNHHTRTRNNLWCSVL